MERLYIPSLQIHEHNYDLLTPQLKIPLMEAKKFAEPLLLSGRPGYNLRHSKAVDYYATRLAHHTGEDELVLRTCSWLHDTGYADVERNSTEYSKEIHMYFSALHAIDFFNQHGIASYYTDEQIRRIIYIIGTHDDIRAPYAHDLITFMEADVLGALSTEALMFSTVETALEYREKSLKPKKNRFESKLAIKLIEPLLERFESYVAGL